MIEHAPTCPARSVIPGACLCSAKPETPVRDAINHPSHYKVGGFECLDVIGALGLGFTLGNALKYLWRAGRKDGTDGLDDLKKARFYLDHEIKQRTGGR